MEKNRPPRLGRAPRLVALAALAAALLAPAVAQAQGRTLSDALDEVRAARFPHQAAIARVAGVPADQVTRRVIVDDVVEYSLVVPVGPGEYDRIGIHRVVREGANGRALRAEDAVFMVHGDVWGFGAAFMADGERSLPVHLAQGGVDVWGIDLGWTLVPADEQDFAFMEDWSLGRDIRDVAVGLEVARLVRGVTGNGLRPMTLLGWSRGGQIGYGYLSAATGLPPVFRPVDSYIPVDIMVKTDVPELASAACQRVPALQAMIDQGTYENNSGVLLGTLGALALTDPDGTSPVVPFLDNYQAALFAGAATFGFFPPGLSVVPFYHFTGGTFSEVGGQLVPEDLTFTDEGLLLRFLTGASPYQSNLELLEGEGLICDQVDLPYDDHLSEIDVPVLYVGAAGGFGEYGVYTTTLLASDDVTVLVPRAFASEEDRLFDRGHADIFLADDAATLYWEPILDWIVEH